MKYEPIRYTDVYDIAVQTGRVYKSRTEFEECIKAAIICYKATIGEYVGCCYILDLGTCYSIDGYNVNGNIKHAREVIYKVLGELESYPYKPLICVVEKKYKDVRVLLSTINMRKVDNYEKNGKLYLVYSFD